jgi:4-amino-4-deoxy-L-arabinose transferase-like glycosyltransferase
LSTSLLLLCLLLFFHRLGDRDLWSSHEARAAMDAQSLLEPDSTGLPRLHDGRMEVQKPPLYYWLVAAIARLRGGEVDALAVRLPSALAALGTVMAVVLGVGVRFRRPAAGLLAGLILATGMHFPWLARIGRIDMPLTFTVTIAAGAFALALRHRSAKPQAAALAACRLRLGGVQVLLLLLAYFACAAGVLLKGPLGLLLPATVVAGYLFAEDRWPAFWEWGAWRKLLGELGLWWGLPLVLLLVAPVFAWAEYASGGQLGREFFWLHNVQRALGGSRLRSHAWWLYAPYFLLYFLPFSPLVVLAIIRRAWRDDPLARRGLAWAVAIVLLLSCARFKRADYLVPAYPGAAVFLGCVLERQLRPGRRGWVLAGVGGLAAVMTTGWVGYLGWRLPAEEAYREYRSFAAEVRRHAPAPACVAFFRTEAHALAFRVGRPLAVIVEWRDLQARLEAPGPHYLVMSPDRAEQCPRFLHGVRLEEVCRNTTLAGGSHERPLVLLRAVGAARVSR